MNTYHDILRLDRPAWYELGLTPEGRLRISVERRCWADVQSMAFLRQKVVGDRNDNVTQPLPPATPPTEATWGYGPVVTTIDRGDPTTIDLVCGWPVILKPSDEDPSWDTAYAMSATLGDLFSALLCWEKTATTPRVQLILIDCWVTLIDNYGGGLAVMLSQAFARWLRSLSDDLSWDSTRQAMMTAHQAMWADQRSPTRLLRDFAVWSFAGRLHLECPGDACGLDPDETLIRPKFKPGYRLYPNNADTPLQQFDLLAGLAAIHDLAKQSLYP